MFASIICALLGSRGKKNVCKSCARKPAVQTLCKPNSPRNLCKLVQKFWPAVARGWPVARPALAARVKAASGTQNRPAIVFAGGLDRGQARRKSIPGRVGRLSGAGILMICFIVDKIRENPIFKAQ